MKYKRTESNLLVDEKKTVPWARQLFGLYIYTFIFYTQKVIREKEQFTQTCHSPQVYSSFATQITEFLTKLTFYIAPCPQLFFPEITHSTQNYSTSNLSRRIMLRIPGNFFQNDHEKNSENFLQFQNWINLVKSFFGKCYLRRVYA